MAWRMETWSSEGRNWGAEEEGCQGRHRVETEPEGEGTPLSRGGPLPSFSPSS